MQSNFKTSKIRATDPHEIAVSVLAWMAGEPELLGRFLALTGVQPDSIRQAAADPGFLGAMMDFVMADEPTALAFCAAAGKTPEDLVAVWQHFSKPGLDSGEY